MESWAFVSARHQAMIPGGAGAGVTTWRVKLRSAVKAAPSVALTTKLKVPVTAGVPLINPDASMVSPPGSDPDTTATSTGTVPPNVATLRL